MNLAGPRTDLLKLRRYVFRRQANSPREVEVLAHIDMLFSELLVLEVYSRYDRLQSVKKRAFSDNVTFLPLLYIC